MLEFFEIEIEGVSSFLIFDDFKNSLIQLSWTPNDPNLSKINQDQTFALAGQLPLNNLDDFVLLFTSFHRALRQLNFACLRYRGILFFLNPGLTKKAIVEETKRIKQISIRQSYIDLFQGKFNWEPVVFSHYHTHCRLIIEGDIVNGKLASEIANLRVLTRPFIVENCKIVAFVHQDDFPKILNIFINHPPANCSNAYAIIKQDKTNYQLSSFIPRK